MLSLQGVASVTALNAHEVASKYDYIQGAVAAKEETTIPVDRVAIKHNAAIQVTLKIIFHCVKTGGRVG